jgi:hypothetical protein
VIFGVVVVAALLVAASTSTAAFGAYNTAWDGTADLRSLAETTETETHLAQNTSAYSDPLPETTVALILAPDQPYHPQETRRIEQFVRDGGTLIVADEQATPTNSLLTAIGADARIDGAPLRDERVYYRAPAAPLLRNLSTDPVMANVSALTLNHGSTVEPGTATVLARTSGYAYRDTNTNQELDSAETVTDYPVVTSETVGQGRVIVLGDASLFINDMLERPGSHQFARNLLTRHQTLLLDYSHTARLPPLIQALLFVRARPLLQFLGGGLGVLAIALLWSRSIAIPSLGSRRSRTAAPQETDSERAAPPPAETAPGSPVPESALVAQLRTRYPDWDDDRLHRIVAARRHSTDADE